MLKQLDPDGTIHLVLSKDEIVDVQELMDAALMAGELGLSRLFPQHTDVMRGLISAAYLLTDEEIIESSVRVHIEHEDPPESVEKMREILRERLKVSRPASVKHTGPTPA